MTTIPQSSPLGALFELVARGKKDTYFVKDSSDSTFLFSPLYDSVAPFITERRTTVPLNGSSFGNTFEIELDPYGDVLTECNVLIQLPTWLPNMPMTAGGQPTSPWRVNNYYHIRGTDGNSYGYVNYPAYYLFSCIQFYQDQVLIQEWSGDGLLATSLTEGSWNTQFLDLVAAGQTAIPETARTIAQRATPGNGVDGILRLRLPLPGMQAPEDGGFPLCCVPNQRFRFRFTLRNLEDIVVSSDRQVKPTPWNLAGFEYTPEGAMAPITVQPISQVAMGQPTILLETVQAYVPEAVKQGLRAKHIEIPFRRQFENIFTFGPLDYAPLERGGTAMVTRRLDARHPTERIVFFFRTQGAFDTNYLSDFTNPDAEQFYQEIKLVIAGRDRETDWPSFVWQDMNAYAKDERDTGLLIGEMRWNLGEVWERRRPAPRQPEGTVNFSTADRPTLHINLERVPKDPVMNQRSAEMRVMAQGWAIYEFKEARGRLLFAT